MDNSSSTITTADTNSTTTNITTVLEVSGDNEHDPKKPTKQAHPKTKKINLYTILNSFIAAILFSQPESKYSSAPFLYRVKMSLSENVPLLREASKNSVDNVIHWSRRGSPLRGLLVVSVGTSASLVLTGLLVFMLFFIAATVNAIVISLLVCLAAVGGFLAMFLACVTAIYVAALSVAAFVISMATVSAMIAVIIATGWTGFFWTVWLGTSGSIHLAKHFLNRTGSKLSA